MKTITLKLAASGVLLAVLSACGGGSAPVPPLPNGVVLTTSIPSPATPMDSTATAPTTVVITPATSAAGANALAKYVGSWKYCDDKYIRSTDIITPTAGSNTLDVNSIIEVFANANCTGAVRATGRFNKPNTTIKFINTVDGATVKLLSAETIKASVDRVDYVMPARSLSFVGEGVQLKNIGGSISVWEFVNPQGNTVQWNTNMTAGTSQGGLLLRNDKLDSLSLTGIIGTEFTFRSDFQLTR